MQSFWFQNYIIQKINHHNFPHELRIEIQDFEGLIPAYIACKKLMLYQNKTPIAHFEKVRLRLSLKKLLRGQIYFKFIKAERLNLENIPKFNSDEPFSLDKITKNIRDGLTLLKAQKWIQRIAIGDIYIAPTITGYPLKGQLSIALPEIIDLSLTHATPDMLPMHLRLHDSGIDGQLALTQFAIAGLEATQTQLKINATWGESVHLHLQTQQLKHPFWGVYENVETHITLESDQATWHIENTPRDCYAAGRATAEHIIIDAFHLKRQGQDLIALEHPTTFDLKKRIFEKETTFHLGSGKLIYQNLNTDQTYSSQLLIQNVSSDFLRTYFSYGAFEGKLNGKIHFSGEPKRPDMDIDLILGNLTYAFETEDLQLKKLGQLIFKGRLNSLNTTFQMRFQNEGQSNLNLSGHIQNIYDNAMLNGKINGQIHLTEIMGLIDPDDLILGTIHTDLTLQGPLMSPHLSGFIRLREGLYEHSDVGTRLENITLDAQAKDQRLVIQNLTAQDVVRDEQNEKKGGVRGEGYIDFKDILSPVVNIKLHMDELDIASSDVFHGQASGFFHLVGTFPHIEVQGDVRLNSAHLFLEELSNADDAFKVDIEGETPIKERKKPNGVLPLNFNLHVENKFFIQGLGFESEWQGQMHIIGFINQPQMVGEIQTRKGKLSIYNKTLDLSDTSRITYIEDAPNIPYLNIQANKDVESLRITLVIQGFANDPKFTFTSSPALPEEEILSLFLFGRDASRISVGQSFQLASALGKLNGSKNGDFLDQFKKSFGFDSIEVKDTRKSSDQSDSNVGSQALSIGKELSQNVRISIDQGSGTANSKATLEATIAPNINLNADVGGDRSSGIGLDYIKRY